MLLEKLKDEGLRKGLSQTTIKTYSHCINKFLRVCQKELHYITKDDIENYLLNLVKWNKSSSTINLNVMALKFFFEKVLKRKLTINIEYTKTRKRLPEFLTQEEINRLFQNITNQKHLLMIKLLYATGMRVSELTHLKVKDFQFDQNYGWVREGKGKKDRLFIIAQKLKDELLRWIKEKNLNDQKFLFYGYGNKPVSRESISKIIKDAAKRSQITKNVHPHTLRHSFATHLIQNGYAVTEVQPLLGHSKIETTMVYLHMVSPNLLSVKSPFDTLNKDDNIKQK